MKDPDCVKFLQIILPQLQLRWSGFRRVRRQVCRRLRNRFRQLGLEDFASYSNYLLHHPQEWSHLDRCCRITISRFYRDRATFEQLSQTWLKLIQLGEYKQQTLRCWSAGCASGEEVYTLKLIEHFRLSHLKSLHILGTDLDEYLLSRAKRGCYPQGCLKELPSSWIAQAFDRNQEYCLKSAFCEGIEFQQQDLRSQMPDGLFELILCRNLALTYFDRSLQIKVLKNICQRLGAKGILVIGKKESLPIESSNQFTQLCSGGIYQKIDAC